jgi:membrane associated rhomboid family serine protease
VPIVNYLLIGLNVLVFLWEQATIAAVGDRRLMLDWALIPKLVVRHPAEYGVNVFTSMFMHDPTGWLHIGGNMLFLWIFGDNVEDALGHGRYLFFYLLSGIGAAAAQILVDPSSTVPMVGASGAIAGVLAAYMSLYPWAPIVVDFVPPLGLLTGFLFNLPAWVLILEFFVVNLLNGLGIIGSAPSGGGVAFFAHVGGFLAGLVLVRFLLPDEPRRDHDRWQGFRPSRRNGPASGYYRAVGERRPWDRWD